jgi:hypothetical protein
MTEDTLAAAGFQTFSLCRKLIGWEGESLMGGGSNASDGGTITAALESMTAQGAGMALESLDPYPDPGSSNASVFAQKPPAAVWADAKGKYLANHAEVNVLSSGSPADRLANVRASIGVDKQAVGFGVWCANNWSDANPVKTNINGGGEYGHAIECRSYALASTIGLSGVDSSEYVYVFPQWWGYIYQPLPSDVVAKWTGMKLWTGPDPNGNIGCNQFIITGTALCQVIDQGNAEVVVCQGATGIPRVAPVPPIPPTPGSWSYATFV